MPSDISSFDLSRARIARALPGIAHSPRTSLDSSRGPALVEIRALAAAGRVAYIPRALERMRGVEPRGVRHALCTAETCHLQLNGRWSVESVDLSGGALAVVVVIREDILVVTEC